MWYSSQNTRNTRTSSRAASAAACVWLRIGRERSSDGSPEFERNVNDEIGRTTSSSRTSKSSAVSEVTGRPLRSMTVASTRMTFVPLRKGGGCWARRTLSIAKIAKIANIANIEHCASRRRILEDRLRRFLNRDVGDLRNVMLALAQPVFRSGSSLILAILAMLAMLAM